MLYLSAMGRITSLFVHKVLSQADQSVDKDAYYKSLGIDPSAPVDSTIMIDHADYYELFTNVVRVDPNGMTLPLRIGAAMRCDDYGAFGLAWKTASNLHGSYESASRYGRVLTTVSRHEIKDADDGIIMFANRKGDRSNLGLRLSIETTVGAIVSMSQEVSTAEFRPRAVYFRHEAPDNGDTHERHFECPVHFGADVDGILISRELMATPNRVGDPAVAKFFGSHLEETLSKLDDDSVLERRIRNQVSQSLSRGIPTISDIASPLGMSARTLQRRLADRGSSFQQLVDEARRELAERLLKESSYQLAEIAFLTGFSEQSAFNRAFKRWAGQTPRSFRLSV